MLLLALAGCRPEKVSKKIEEALPTKPLATVSAEPNSFDEVTAQLDRGGSFYAYLSTEQVTAGLSERLNSWQALLLGSPLLQGSAQQAQGTQLFQVLGDIIRKSGVEEISGAGLSSIAVEPGLYRNKFFIHHYADKNQGLLWSAFGKTPHSLKALDLLPADTALASFGDFDLGPLFDFVRQEVEQVGGVEAKQGLDRSLQQFATTAGMSLDELLQSLGGSAGVVITLDSGKTISLPISGQNETVPLPRVAIFLKVKDDRIFKHLEQMMGTAPGLVKVDESQVRMRIFAQPVLPDVTLRLTLAQWGEYLVVASDDQLVRDAMAAQQSGQGYKATPEFAQLAAGLPTEGNSFQITSQRFIEGINHLHPALLKNQPMITPDQYALIEKLLGSSGQRASYSVSVNTPTGWLSVGKAHVGGSQMIAPLIVAPAALAAGMALPVFGEVQKRGKAAKSLSNAKQIGLACKIYAADYAGAFPPNLDALIPDYLPNRAAFISPFAPQEPMGYLYHPGLTEKSPAETVLVEDRFSQAEQQRVVVHVDCSGEVTKLRKQP